MLSNKKDKFALKRIEITVGKHNYDVHLKEYDAKFYVTGSVYCEVIPSFGLAKAALAKASELSFADKQMYADAFEAIVRVICPCGDWAEVAKIKKEYGLL